MGNEKSPKTKCTLFLEPGILYTVKMHVIDFNLVPIPTLRRDNSGIEPCQVGIPISPDKVRIPTLRRTILKLSRFLFCVEHNYIFLRDRV